MPRHTRRWCAVMSVCLAGATSSQSVLAQTSATAPSPSAAPAQQRPPARKSIRAAAPDMVTFMSGTWSCDGAFANGKPLSATIEFREVLGGSFMTQLHDDTPPGGYHALSMWGAAPDSGLVATIFDSGNGERQLIATGGWKDNRVVLQREMPVANRTFYEHFIYARESANTMRMTWETSPDATTWRMGDYILCTRK